MRHVIPLVFFTFMSIGIVSAESPPTDDLGALRSEIRALQEGQKAILKELETMKTLLNGRKRALKKVQDVSLTINIGQDPVKGRPEATITLIEFTDYQCPYCSRHTQSVLPLLEKHFIQPGKLKYILRDFPIASLHPHAAKAHEAAHCAGEQGQYWTMHDQLFTNHKALQPENLAGYAQQAGVPDEKAFQLCLETQKFHQRTQDSIAEGTKAGIRGTPSFLLGIADGEGNAKVSKLIRGAQPYSVFQDHITRLLNVQD